MLFSEADLRRVLADDGFRPWSASSAKRSFLFIGFDPADPDFGIVVDRVLVGGQGAGRHRRAGAAHFALFTGVPRVVQEEIEASYGIRALPTEQFPRSSRCCALSEALGVTGEFLPDEDDLEGWLRVLQQEPNRTDAVDALAAIERRLDERGDADRLIELWLGRTEVETTPLGGLAACAASPTCSSTKGQMAEAFQSALAAFREVPELASWMISERLAGISGGWVDLLERAARADAVFAGRGAARALAADRSSVWREAQPRGLRAGLAGQKRRSWTFAMLPCVVGCSMPASS